MFAVDSHLLIHPLICTLLFIHPFIHSFILKNIYCVPSLLLDGEDTKMSKVPTFQILTVYRAGSHGNEQL